MTTLQHFNLLCTKVKQTKGKQTNTHLSEFSNWMKALFQDTRSYLPWLSTGKENGILGHANTSGDYPKLIQDAVHKQNLIREVLTHEWKID